ncbi:hypothetical protein L1987_38216 [Smallanthus sonchifolius]|uniref:Uncharacterized protein n=1 Tax=Smallanthus sonchifolius TaxID=185202 RepID=A0ACB9HJA1_9ASTR|nr:hypothetical protein L1987_38216 [Smallanthus sonchifolius]
MTYAGLQMLMEKLKQLINCNHIPFINHPSVICERPQFQLLYEDLGSMIQTLFIDQHQDLHDLEKLNDLKKRFTVAAEEAQYIIDLFLSGVHIRNTGRFPTSEDFKCTLNLDDVRRSLESVKVEFMSMRTANMKMDSYPRSDRTLDQSATTPISFTRNPQGSKKHLRSDVPSMKVPKSITPLFIPTNEKPMNLQTISNVMLGNGVNSFQKNFPCIKELTCNINLDEENDFSSLTYLEKLNLTVHRRTKLCVDDSPRRKNHIKLPATMKTLTLVEPNLGKNHITFPATLKTLTLRDCGLLWSDMSIIQSLPNLQVLKLTNHAFKGSCWNTHDQEFPQLKFLKLQSLDIKLWEAYRQSFPCLRQLEVFYCDRLEEIPLEIGDIPTLDLIQIKECTNSVGESVRRIQEEQHDLGNYNLKIDIRKG